MKFQKLLRTLLPICALSLMSFDSPRAELRCPKCDKPSVEIIRTPDKLYAICNNCHYIWLYF